MRHEETAVHVPIVVRRVCRLEEDGIDPDILRDITGLPYYNTSKWPLNRLKAQATNSEAILLDNFNEYLRGYSDNIKDILQKFGFIAIEGKQAAEKTQKLSDNHRLLAVIERITDPCINLTDKEVTGPDGLKIPALDNIGMGKVFEELLRRFNEENNEEAGIRAAILAGPEPSAHVRRLRENIAVFSQLNGTI